MNAIHARSQLRYWPTQGSSHCSVDGSTQATLAADGADQQVSTFSYRQFSIGNGPADVSAWYVTVAARRHPRFS